MKKKKTLQDLIDQQKINLKTSQSYSTCYSLALININWLIVQFINDLYYQYTQNLHSILSSIGALGWKTERARANSSKPSIPLCFVSNKSNTCNNEQ